VISKIIAGFSMGEDGQIAPIEDCPGGKLPKSLLGEGELTTSTRMRPDRSFVEAADFNANKACASRASF
jgi:hypothetical protein